MKKALLAIFLATNALAGTGGPDDPESTIGKMQALKRKRRAEDAAAKEAGPPFQFAAPEGFTIVQTLGADMPEGPPPQFMAQATKPAAATVFAYVDDGAPVIDAANLVDEARKLGDKWTAAHPGGTFKVVKKDVVPIDAGSALRILAETKLNAKKATKPMRELHGIFASEKHRGHIVFRTTAAAYGKLEKGFDAALRKTMVLEKPTAKAPKPEPAKAQPAK